MRGFKTPHERNRSDNSCVNYIGHLYVLLTEWYDDLLSQEDGDDGEGWWKKFHHNMLLSAGEKISGQYFHVGTRIPLVDAEVFLKLKDKGLSLFSPFVRVFADTIKDNGGLWAKHGSDYYLNSIRLNENTRSVLADKLIFGPALEIAQMQEKTKLLKFMLYSLNNQDFASIPMVSNVILTPEDLEWIFSNHPTKSRAHFNRKIESSPKKSSQEESGAEEKDKKKKHPKFRMTKDFKDEKDEKVWSDSSHVHAQNTASTQESIKEEAIDNTEEEEE